MRSARSRMRADHRKCSSSHMTKAMERKSHRMSQYPPSKYALDLARSAGGILARYCSTAASMLNGWEGAVACEVGGAANSVRLFAWPVAKHGRTTHKIK